MSAIEEAIRLQRDERKRLLRIEEAARDFVMQSNRPESKHDAERFDRLCEALGIEPGCEEDAT